MNDDVKTCPQCAEALRQQLTAAKTRILNLRVDAKMLSESLREARTANPVTLTKAEATLFKKVFHPDPEHSTATPARKKQLNDAAIIFSSKKFRVID